MADEERTADSVQQWHKVIVVQRMPLIGHSSDDGVEQCEQHSIAGHGAGHDVHDAQGARGTQSTRIIHEVLILALAIWAKSRYGHCMISWTPNVHHRAGAAVTVTDTAAKTQDGEGAASDGSPEL